MSWPRSGADHPPVRYRPLRQRAEFEAAVDLQMRVWGIAPVATIPWSQMHVVARNGGVILGAYLGPRLIGFDMPWASWHSMSRCARGAG